MAERERSESGLPEKGGGSGGRSTGDQPRLRGPWWFGRRRKLSEEQERSLLSQLYFEGPDRSPFLARFSLLLAFSLLIAVFGLAEDSSAVVIGAMLISPLATPLLGLAASLVMGWPRRQAESLAIVVAGSAGAIALAWLALLVLPEPRGVTLASQQLIDRTEPSLLDLGIAIVAGGAGAYVLLRREAIGALPGVAIAVALVPPLATIGMMLELGEYGLAEEAFLLFAANVAGIVLAGALVLLLAGMRPQTVHGRLTRRARVGVTAAALAVLVVAYPLGLTTSERLQSARDHNRASGVAGPWLADAGLRLREAEVEDGTVRIEIAGPEPPETLDPLADMLAEELDEDVALRAEWVREELFEAEGSP